MSSSPDSPERRDSKAQMLADEQLVRAKDLRRFKLETRALYAVAVGLAAIVLVLYGRITDVVDQIQTERTRNTLTACNAGNQQNAAITRFIENTVPSSQRDDPRAIAYLQRASTTFPQRNCALQLRQRVRGARP